MSPLCTFISISFPHAIPLWLIKPISKKEITGQREQIQDNVSDSKIRSSVPITALNDNSLNENVLLHCKIQQAIGISPV